MPNKDNKFTIYDVAKKAKVSLATVSRVLNNSTKVKAKTKEKILKIIEENNYKPSELAKSLATNSNSNIAVILPSANYVYISNLLYGLTETAKKNNLIISLYITSRNKKSAKEMVEKVIRSRVDGVIVFDDELDENDLTNLGSYKMNIICINNKIEGPNLGSIQFGYEHLIKKIIKKELEENEGKKEVSILHIPHSGRLLSRIELALIDLHDSLNKNLNFINVTESYKETYEKFKTYFKTHKNGYFITPRDSIAFAIINAAIQNNLKVPEDVEVLSILGTKYSAISRPTLSHLYINMIDVGKKAIEMLIKLMNKDLENKIYKFESDYIKLSSTKE